MKSNTQPLHLRCAKCTRTPCAMKHLVSGSDYSARDRILPRNVLQLSEEDWRWGKGRDVIIFPIESDTKTYILFGGGGGEVDNSGRFTWDLICYTSVTASTTYAQTAWALKAAVFPRSTPPRRFRVVAVRRSVPFKMR